MRIYIIKEIGKGQGSMYRLFLIMMLAWILSLAGHTACFATTVGLQWDAITDPELVGYKIYYQADSSAQPFTGTGAIQGNSPVDVQNLTTATIGGLDPAHAYYIAITAYYSSGVESSYSNAVYVPELVSPTTSITSPTNNTTVNGTVSVTASGNDNVGVTKLEFYVNGALVATDTATPYVYSWNTSSLAAGTYTLMTKAYDAAGNVGQSTNVAVTVVSDITAPVVSVTAPVNNATVSGTVAIIASASDNVGVSNVEFYANGVLLFAGNVAPYTYNWNTTTVANGSYTLTAKAYDNAGNIAQSSNKTVTVSNDTTAPTVSVFTMPSSANSLTVVVSSFTATDLVGVTGYLITKTATAPAATATGWSASAPTSFTFSSTGSQTAYAWAKDAAGNVSARKSATVIIDTTAPIVSAFQLPATATSLSVAISSLSATDSVGVTGYLITESATAPAAAASGWSASAPSLFTFSSTGSKTAYAWAKDNAGNISASRSATVSITLPDTTAPVVSFTAPGNNSKVNGTVAITSSASDNVGVSRVEYYINGTLLYISNVAPYMCNWNTTSVANGIYTLTAKAYDTAGNIGQSSNVSVTVLNDTTTPTVSIGVRKASSGVSGLLSVTATSNDNVGVSRVEFYVNGTLASTATVAPYIFNWDSKSVANGSYTLIAKAYDAAGNFGQSGTVKLSKPNVQFR